MPSVTPGQVERANFYASAELRRGPGRLATKHLRDQGWKPGGKQAAEPRQFGGQHAPEADADDERMPETPRPCLGSPKIAPEEHIQEGVPAEETVPVTEDRRAQPRALALRELKLQLRFMISNKAWS